MLFNVLSCLLARSIFCPPYTAWYCSVFLKYSGLKIWAWSWVVTEPMGEVGMGFLATHLLRGTLFSRPALVLMA